MKSLAVLARKKALERLCLRFAPLDQWPRPRFPVAHVCAGFTSVCRKLQRRKVPPLQLERDPQDPLTRVSSLNACKRVQARPKAFASVRKTV